MSNYIVKVNALNQMTGEMRCASIKQVKLIISGLFNPDRAEILLKILENNGYCKHDDGNVSFEAIPVGVVLGSKNGHKSVSIVEAEGGKK